VIGVAGDHAAVETRQAVIALLKERGLQVRDFGTHDRESCDYPDFVIPCAEALARGELDRAVVFCGSGIGASICANKVRGVRAALCLEAEQAALCRKHNDANCLALAGRLRSIEQNLEYVRIWLEAEFEGGRHERRIGKLHERTGC